MTSRSRRALAAVACLTAAPAAIAAAPGNDDVVIEQTATASCFPEPQTVTVTNHADQPIPLDFDTNDNPRALPPGVTATHTSDADITVWLDDERAAVFAYPDVPDCGSDVLPNTGVHPATTVIAASALVTFGAAVVITVRRHSLAIADEGDDSAHQKRGEVTP